jgi:hypothetical protein
MQQNKLVSLPLASISIHLIGGIYLGRACKGYCTLKVGSRPHLITGDNYTCGQCYKTFFSFADARTK